MVDYKCENLHKKFDTNLKTKALFRLQITVRNKKIGGKSSLVTFVLGHAFIFSKFCSKLLKMQLLVIPNYSNKRLPLFFPYFDQKNVIELNKQFFHLSPLQKLLLKSIRIYNFMLKIWNYVYKVIKAWSTGFICIQKYSKIKFKMEAGNLFPLLLLLFVYFVLQQQTNSSLFFVITYQTLRYLNNI